MSAFHPIIERYQEVNHFGKENDFQLHVIAPGEIEYTTTVNEKDLATPKAAHGGYISALMDAVLSVAGLSKSCEDNFVVATIEFKINYLRPAFLNDTLKAKGKVIKYGRDLIFSEAVIVNQDGKKIATGSGTLTKIPFEKANW